MQITASGLVGARPMLRASPIDSRSEGHFEQFARILASTGLRDALIYILGLSQFRFIGIFRLQGDKVHAVIHYDRVNPSIGFEPELPEFAAHCCYVHDSLGRLVPPSAMADPGLAHHPAHDSVPAYCGVPIMHPGGQLLATLCLYDLVASAARELNIKLLMQVASALQQGNHIPASASSR